MKGSLTKSQVVARLGAATGLDTKTSAAYLEALASLAYREAKNGFAIPGIGKLVIRGRKARRGRIPSTGATFMMLNRRRVAFVVAKAAVEATIGGFGTEMKRGC